DYTIHTTSIVLAFTENRCNIRIMLDKYYDTVMSRHMNDTVLFNALINARFQFDEKRGLNFSDFFYAACRDNREFFVEDIDYECNDSRFKIVLLNIFDNNEKNCWYNNLIRYMILSCIYDNNATPVQLIILFDKFMRLGFAPDSISSCLKAFQQADMIRTDHYDTLFIDRESTERVVCTMAGKYYIERLIRSLEYAEMMQFSTMSSHVKKSLLKKDALTRYSRRRLIPDFVNYLYNEELIAEAVISNFYDYETYKELMNGCVKSFSDILRISYKSYFSQIAERKKTTEKGIRRTIDSKQRNILEQIIKMLDERVIYLGTLNLLKRLKKPVSTIIPATPLIVANRIVESYYADKNGMKDVNVLKLEAICRLTLNGIENYAEEVLFEGYDNVKGGLIFSDLSYRKDTLKKLDFILLRTVKAFLPKIAAAGTGCVSVNLSDALIEDTELCHHILSELAETVTDVSFNCELVIELPEKIEAENIVKAKNIINKFNMFKYALDDFYTHESIHKHIYDDLPDMIHWLKVDFVFFKKFYEHIRNKLRESILVLIDDIKRRNLNTCVVVEGVELPEHRIFLREIIKITGFDRLYIQGWGVKKV
ncbi:hypothetical protein, partial [Candidatus Magnetominusculus dajiuhuensis]|uniref:hypothetical protein n=1 Tax=Candidatus Magnetominusculus dajiuhuensis TaxID=3137712 RepID=UPI003B43331F